MQEARRNGKCIRKFIEGPLGGQSVESLAFDLYSGLDLSQGREFGPCIRLHTRRGAYFKKKKNFFF